MSMLLMVQAMQTKVGNPLRKLVLIKLADNANDKGECWPSFQHIADQCEISRRSVINHVNALIESGLLKKQTRKGPKGNSSNIYVLSLDGAGDSLGGSAGDSPPSAGDSLGGSAGAAPRTSHSSEPVNEPKKINKKTNANAFNFSKWPTVPDEDVWADYVKHRQRLKAPLTQTAVSRLGDEAHKAVNLGFPVDDFLAECMMRGWRGGKAEWLKQEAQKGKNQAKHGNFAQQDYSAGVDENGYF